MTRLLISIFILCSAAINAQNLQYLQIPAENYLIEQMGYPSNIIPLSMGQFGYVEYCVADKLTRIELQKGVSEGQYKMFDGLYFQAVDARNFNMPWFRPVTPDPKKPFELLEVKSMRNVAVILGKQADNSNKTQIIARFLSVNTGQENAKTQLSNFDTKIKDAVDVFEVSPDRNRLLWLNYKPDDKLRKRELRMGVWGADGKKIWSKNLNLPENTAEGSYEIVKQTVDAAANVYLLIESNKKEEPPKIIVCNATNTNAYPLSYQSGRAVKSIIAINHNKELLVFSILTDREGKPGFENGAKTGKESIKWNGLALKKFNLEPAFSEAGEIIIDLPNNWVAAAQAGGGANYTRMEILTEKIPDKTHEAYLLLEEAFTATSEDTGQDQWRHENVAVAAFDTKNNTLRWAGLLAKKQRDELTERNQEPINWITSYFPLLTGKELSLIYIDVKGAKGNLKAAHFDKNTGTLTEKVLRPNSNGEYYFFPQRSTMLGEGAAVLLGLGDRKQNEYRLIRITY
jgi:hypothetical protein